MYLELQKLAETKERGLHLFQLPTGYGKTYSIVRFIRGKLNTMEKGEKIIYITQLKKNLAGEDLKKEFKNIKEYEENVLVVKSILDQYLESFHLLKNNKIGIPFELQTQAYRKMLHILGEYIELTSKRGKSQWSYMIPELLERFTECEKEFRYDVKSHLKSLDLTPQQLLKEIKRPESPYNWIKDLYPATFISDYKVIIMTVHKCLTPNISLVEPNFDYYSSKFLKGATVFVDEFDATKGVIEDIIIESSMRENTEILDLFNKLHRYFRLEDFNKDLSKSVENIDNKIMGNGKSQMSNSKLKTSRELIQKANKINKKYSTNLSYKLVGDKIDMGYNFLLFDGEFLTINEQESKFKCIANELKQQVDIDYLNALDMENLKNGTKLEVGNFPLQDCLYEIVRYLESMQQYINYWAQEYQHINNQSRPVHINEMVLEEAINTIAQKLKLTKSELQVLVGVNQRSILKVSNYQLRDPNVHEKGFSYCIFRDNNNHADTTKINYYKIPYTPEKYLLHMAKCTNVICVSATAEINSVIANYDLAYLKRSLGEDYHITSPELKKRIEAEQEVYYAPYRNDEINVRVDIIGEEFEDKQNLTDDEFKIRLHKMLEKAIEKKRGVIPWLSDLVDEAVQIITGDNQYNNAGKSQKNSYNNQRYCKFLYNVIVFITTTEIQSFLHLGKMLPNAKTYDIDILNALFNLAADYCNVDLTAQKNLVILDSNEYERKKLDIQELLKSGQKILILSSYTTVGAGQNLQHELVEGRETVMLGEYNKEDSRYRYKDIDAIYMGEVTQILPNINGESISKKELLTRITNMERLYMNYEIDSATKKMDIRNTFKSYSGIPRGGKSVDVKSLKSYKVAAQRTMIQALGRLCRTFQKNKEIYIGLDYKMLEKIDIKELEGMIKTPELEKLIGTLKHKMGYEEESGANIEDDLNKKIYQTAAKVKSTEVHKWTMKQLDNPWTYDSSSVWEDLREFVLTHPTLGKEEFDNYNGDIPIENFYITNGNPLNTYLYNQIDDYKNVYVSFQMNKKLFWKDCNHPQNNKLGIYEMSEESSGLERILKYPGMKKYFKDAGYAIGYDKNHYMMAPAIYNNYYKGALGEVAGKFILTQELGLEISSIDNLEFYEKFDYKIGEDVYIDFKNWGNRTGIDGNSQHIKIKKKMKQIGARLVFIVNVQGDENFTPRQNLKDGIIEIPSLINMDGDIVKENIDLINKILKGDDYATY